MRISDQADEAVDHCHLQSRSQGPGVVVVVLLVVVVVVVAHGSGVVVVVVVAPGRQGVIVQSPQAWPGAEGLGHWHGSGRPVWQVEEISAQSVPSKAQYQTHSPVQPGGGVVGGGGVVWAQGVWASAQANPPAAAGAGHGHAAEQPFSMRTQAQPPTVWAHFQRHPLTQGSGVVVVVAQGSGVVVVVVAGSPVVVVVVVVVVVWPQSGGSAAKPRSAQ